MRHKINMITAPQGNHIIQSIPTRDLSDLTKSGLIGACKRVGSRAERTETREQDMTQSQLAHHTWKQQGVPMMDGPAVTMEADELDEQAGEAEAATSASTSTEAAALDLKPQDVAVVTHTHNHISCWTQLSLCYAVGCSP